MRETERGRWVMLRDDEKTKKTHLLHPVGLLLAVLAQVHVQIEVQVVVVQKLRWWLHRRWIGFLLVPQSSFRSVLSCAKHQHHVAIQHRDSYRLEREYRGFLIILHRMD